MIWVFATGFYLVGDLILTFVGLNMGLSETGPLAEPVVKTFGFTGLVVTKSLSILLFYALYRILPKWNKIVPVLVLVDGMMVCIWNLGEIISY
jgi:hypothetical protein